MASSGHDGGGAPPNKTGSIDEEPQTRPDSSLDNHKGGQEAPSERAKPSEEHLPGIKGALHVGGEAAHRGADAMEALHEPAQAHVGVGVAEDEPKFGGLVAPAEEQSSNKRAASPGGVSPGSGVPASSQMGAKLLPDIPVNSFRPPTSEIGVDTPLGEDEEKPISFRGVSTPANGSKAGDPHGGIQLAEPVAPRPGLLAADNREIVKKSMDGAIAHDILFERRKQADQVAKERARAERRVSSSIPRADGTADSKGIKKHITGWRRRLLILMGMLGAKKAQPEGAAGDTADTSETPDHSARRTGGPVQKSSSGKDRLNKGAGNGDNINLGSFESDKDLLPKSTAGSSMINVANQPRQRWVTATWYAAQEVQRQQLANPEAHQPRLNLVEAVKQVMKQDEQEVEKRLLEEKRRKNKIAMSYIDSKPVTLTMLAATIYVLYASDLYFMSRPPLWGDDYIYAITFVCTILFFFEFVVRSVFVLEPRYRFSFFFWLDAIAIISLIPELTFWLGGTNLFGEVGFLTIARSGRAARAGTRAARIIRVLQIIQKWKQLAINKRRNQIKAEEGDDKDKDEDEESRLGRTKTHEEEIGEGNDMGSRLDARITRYFVVCVGSMLIVSILVQLMLEDDWTTGYAGDVKVLGNVFANLGWDASSPVWVAGLTAFIEGKVASGNPVLYLELGGHWVYGDEETIKGYRRNPESAVIIEVHDLEYGDGTCVMHVEDIDGPSKAALGNILLTTAVIIILGGMTWTMSSSVRREIVFPMEGLMRIIASIRLNPMKPVVKQHSPEVSQVAEVQAIEKALVQLGFLLQLGFGEAGAKIIRSSLKDNAIDGNLPGKVVNAIFGFCDIRNFTDCTEVLQADVVKLVNNVASIVHRIVDENHGAANKNIGDAFLLVWKPKGEFTVKQIAESALRSYISIIIEMTRDNVLKQWAQRPDIQERMPNYHVRLGFGLHFGWAIECAIGSKYKVDASYLSPHVNLSSRLEAATKQYGVPILLSGDIHGLFSDEVKALCRVVDRVTVKGSNTPMYLYTYDVPATKSMGGTLADDIKLDEKDLSLSDFWKRCRPYTGDRFRLSWEMAMRAYIGGNDGKQADWRQSKNLLKKILVALPNDGPALAILSYIEANAVDEHCRPPENWPGYRSLTEK